MSRRALVWAVVPVVAIVGASLTSIAQASSAPATVPLTVAATSNPASGGAVRAGTTVTYTLTATSQAALPSGAKVVDDLAGLLPTATISTTSADLAKQNLALNQKAKTLTWKVPALAAPGTPGSTAKTSFRVTVDPTTPGGAKLTTAAAPPGQSCAAADPCATTLRITAAPSTSSTTTTTTITAAPGLKRLAATTTTTTTTVPAPPKPAPPTSASPTGAVAPASRAAATLPAAADPCAPGGPGSVVVAGFEIDGNLCVNNPPNDDWASVGGQPVANDLYGSLDSTQFTQGAKEQVGGANGWPWPLGNVSGTGSSPSSADIGNVYATTRISANNVYAIFGFERQTSNGSVQYYLELNQLPNLITPGIATPPGPSPNRTTGDLRLTFSQTGNTTISMIGADKWSSAANNWVSLGSLAGFSSAVNQIPVLNLSGTTLPIGTFAEVAINLTALFGPADCSGNYGTMNLRSQSSSGGNPSLGDWIQPKALSVPSTCASVLVNKSWNIDGTTYPNGSQPSGFTATLSLTGRATPQFGVEYPTRDNGTHYLAGDSVTVGETVTIPAGCTNTQGGDLGLQTLVPGKNTFAVTNTVKCTYLTLKKAVVGGSATPGQWTLSASGPTPVTGAGNSAAVTQVRVAPGTYTLTEAGGPTGYLQTSLVCSPNSIANINTVTLLQGDNVTCTFTNSATHALTLTKVWQNAIPGDTVGLTITGPRSSATGTSTAPNTTNPAILTVLANDAVVVAENFTTGDPANYTTTLACTNGVTPDASGSFTVPLGLAPGTPIGCTFTNSRQPATVQLTKVWRNAIAGDTVTLTITSGTATAPGSSTAPSTTTPASLGVFQGDTVGLTELFTTGVAANYTSSLTCNRGIQPDASGSFTVPDTLPSGATILCAFTNIRKQAKIVLQKTWVNGANNDRAVLSITGSDALTADTATSVAAGVAGADTDTTNFATAPIFAGGQVNLTESLPLANIGSYTTSLACDNGVTPNASGSFTVPNTLPVGTTVTCTFTNTRTQATVTLQKQWVGAAAGDKSQLVITGSDPATRGTATSTAIGGDQLDTTNVATAPIFSGGTVTVQEILPPNGVANTGSYTATISCPGITITLGAGREGTTFTVPPVPQNVTCTVINTRTTAQLTLVKVWANGAAPDSAALTVTGGTVSPVSVTATVPAGGSGESVDRAVTTIASGQSINLAEVLGAGNAGTYTSGLTCNQPGLTANADGRSGTYLVPSTAPDVVCTFTNTRTSANLVLRKAWVNALAGDKTDLLIDGSDPATSGSPTGSATSTALGGSQIDTTNVATAPIFSGGTVTLTETLADANKGGYSASLACTNGISPDASGSFTVPSNLPAGTTVTCTFTNDHNAARVVLTKSWQNAIPGDTVGLKITDGTASTTGSSTAPGPTTPITLPVFTGDTVAVTENFTVGNAPNYTSTLLCDNGVTPDPSGSFTVPSNLPAGATVSCTFTNARNAATVVLTKQWINAIAGDSVNLAVTDGTVTGNGSSTAPATTLNATLGVFAGDTVGLTEAFISGSAANYKSTLACDNEVTPGPGHSFTVPDNLPPGTTITCTFTNARKAATVVLTKLWVNAITGDSVALTVTDGTASGTGSSTAPATTTNATLPVFAGDTVSVAEAFITGDPANYTSTLSCDSGVTPGAGGAFTVPGTAGTVTCAFTNARKAATVVLTKQWVNPITGDTVELALGDHTTGTVDVGSSTAPVTTNPATLNVFAGDTVGSAEGFIVGDPANYTTTLACDSGVTPAADGTFTVPSTATTVTCTFTNDRKAVTVVLTKQWGNAIAGDTVALNITEGSTSATGSSTAPGPTTPVNLPVFAGDSVRVTEAFTVGNAANYTATLSCDSGVTPGAGGSFTVPSTAATVTCTFTNDRKAARVVLTKQWGNAIAGDTVSLTVTDGSASNVGSSTAPATTTDATLPVFAGDSVSVSEAFTVGNAANYTATLSCDSGVTPGAGGSFTVPSTAATVTCTFTNDRKAARVVLTKLWTNAIAGDTVSLTVTDGSASNVGSSTAPATTTDATLGVFAGDSVNVAEAFTVGNAANYASLLSCTNGVVPNAGGSFTVPDTVTAGTTITCTFTNDRKPARVVLTKQWVNAIAGDRVSLTVTDGSASNIGSSTAPATTTDATLPVFAGDTVRVSEAFTVGNAANYTSSLGCDSGVMLAGNGSFTVPSTATTVTCTFTNDRKAATVVLTKQWGNAIAGDTVALDITEGSTTASGSSTAPGPTTPVSLPVFAGDSVRVSEAFTVGNPANYTSTLACDSGVTPGAGGSFTVPSTATTVTCTFTNDRNAARVVLTKHWVNAIAGDTVSLTVTDGSASNIGSSTAPATTTNATLPVFAGDTVSVAEAFTVGDSANYTSTLACDHGVTPGAGGSFTVPDTVTAGTTITCTFTNDRKAARVVLTKLWVNAIAGDSVGLSIHDGSTTASGSSTAPATTTDATLPVFAGDTVRVAEAFTHGNAANYTTTLACDNGVTPGAGGSFTVPSTAPTVTCTFTNDRKAATVVLTKLWGNAIAGDTVALNITEGSTTASGSSTAPGPTTPVSLPVFAGDSVRVSEAFTMGNPANYTSTLACDSGVTPGAGGTFTVPSTAATVTCTFTNDRNAARVVLTKHWDPVAIPGDTVSLTVTHGSTTASGSSMAPATPTSPPTTTDATLPVFAGDTVSVSEAFTVGNAGNYTATLACDSGVTPGAGGSFTVPSSGGTVTCTFTNTRKDAKVVLQKAWVNGAKGDQADLSVDSSDPVTLRTSAGSATSTASGIAGTETDTTNRVTVPIFFGGTVTVTESLLATNSITYTPALACDNGVTPDASGSFTVPNTIPIGTTITCTFTNAAPLPNPTVLKTVTSNTQNADGTWTTVFDVAVTNPDHNRPTSFTLHDTLAFGTGITVNSATVTGPGANPGWNGTTDTTVVTNRSLGAGATEHYTVTVNATVTADATSDDRSCSTQGGFTNTANVSVSGPASSRLARAAAGSDPAGGQESTACADPASPTITKKVVSVVAGSSPGQSTITYEVTVSNGSHTQLTYSLHDPLGFPVGVTITSTSASRVHSALDGSAATAPEPIPGWTGTGSGAVLATNRALPPQSKDTYTLVVGATVTANLPADAAACSAAGAGHGYFNSATVTSGSDQFRADACAPITPLPAPGSPAAEPPPAAPSAPSGPLPFTGLVATWYGIAALALLGTGALLLVVARRGRRRTVRGKHSIHRA
jgi:hypothetical protein